MIEIECFKRDRVIESHEVKIWFQGKLVFMQELATPEDLVQLRNSLNNELLWMNDYLRKKGIKGD